MHRDFTYVLQNIPSKTFLQSLKAGWKYYKDYVEKDNNTPENEEPNTSRTQMRDQLGASSVKCIDNRNCALNRTFLPLEELTRHAGQNLPFLDVPNPEEPAWRDILTSIGVGFKSDVKFYIRCLESLKAQNSPNTTQVSNLIEQIQARSSEDEAFV